MHGNKLPMATSIENNQDLMIIFENKLRAYSVSCYFAKNTKSKSDTGFSRKLEKKNETAGFTLYAIHNKDHYCNVQKHHRQQLPIFYNANYKKIEHVVVFYLHIQVFFVKLFISNI